MKFLKLGKPALTYRLFTKLVIGLVISIFLLPISILLSSTNNPALIYIFIFQGIPLIIFIVLSLIEYKNCGFAIEENSLNFRKGIFSIETMSIPYVRITNAKFKQNLLQRIFGVGHIIIDQEDSESVWKNYDQETANKITNQISSKSNIQPIK